EARDVRALLPAPALGEHQHDLPRPGGGRRPPTAARTGHTPVGLPLAGVRVLSFGVGAVIPEATSFLALMGAEVIKVESSNGLDFFRQVGGDATGDINNSATFNQANLGVQSCAVNAASEEGRAVLRTLVATCDIVMENMRGPVMRKFGMDYESVRAVRPDIIYISSQGFGTGPYETFQTYGPSLQSFAGMTSIWAHPDDPYPVGSTLSYPDMLAGKQGLAAVLAALVRRDATGRGCALDCAQFEVCLWSIADKFLQEQLLPGTVRALGNRSLDAAPHGCFPCAGADQWCALSVDDDEAWRRFVELIDDQRLGGARFATAAARVSMADEIDPIVGEWTSRSTPADVVELLRGRGIAASIIVDGASQAADRAMHDSGFYVAIAHPAAGVRWHTGLPFVLDGDRVPVRRAPIIGEHTEHVLLDVLGVSPSDLSHLVASGAVGT
ncbi:MAG: hypothetical protein JWM12_249, partial [Ilumatobacteraceae bacterium]|nr:hypothetical protein [Ilumatobacteraceae bacterium]